MISQSREWLKNISRPLDLNVKGDVDMIEMIIPMLEKDLAGSAIKGVGLSAIQIGHPVRFSILRAPKANLNLINPVIIEKEDPMVFRGEGCLSFPNIYKNTRRFNQITLENYTMLGEKQLLMFEGFESVAVQHEVDHLDGIIFLDRLQQPLVAGNKIGRNDPCPCGSGKKFKKCCEV